MHRTFVLRNDQNAKALYAFLKANWRALADSNRPLSVSVAEHKSKRSMEQNKRYWVILGEIADQSWVGGRKFSAEAWHEHFKRTFIGYEETPGGGQIGISTSKLSVAEFSEYMARVEAYAATELGVEISQ